MSRETTGQLLTALLTSTRERIQSQMQETLHEWAHSIGTPLTQMKDAYTRLRLHVQHLLQQSAALQQIQVYAEQVQEIQARIDDLEQLACELNVFSLALEQQLLPQKVPPPP